MLKSWLMSISLKAHVTYHHPCVRFDDFHHNGIDVYSVSCNSLARLPPIYHKIWKVNAAFLQVDRLPNNNRGSWLLCQDVGLKEVGNFSHNVFKWSYLSIDLFLLAKISSTNVKGMASICNTIHTNIWLIIAYPSLNFINGLGYTFKVMSE